MSTEIDELDRILNYYGMRCAYEALGEVPADSELLTKPQAKAEIQAWALDIVGEDEPRHFDYVDGGDVEIAGAFIRNQLRQEIRDRIKGE